MALKGEGIAPGKSHGDLRSVLCVMLGELLPIWRAGSEEEDNVCMLVVGITGV